MMNYPNREMVEMIRKTYPAGTRVELIDMDDPQAPPAGTRGTVIAVDALGDLIMKWDNGSRLNVVWRQDRVKKV